MKTAEPNRSPWWQSKRTLALAGAAALLLILSGSAYAIFFTEPPRPWVVKQRIQRYLKTHTGHSNFTVPFEFPSAAEMAQAGPRPTAEPPKGALTQKDFNSLREEYLDQMTELLVLRRKTEDQEIELKDRRARLAAMEQRAAKQAKKNGAATNGTNGTPSAEATNGTPATAGATVTNANLQAMRDTIAKLEQSIRSQQKTMADKRQALDPIETDLRAFQNFWTEELQSNPRADTNKLLAAQAELNKTVRTQLGQATTYRRIYELIGQELWVAGRLGQSANPLHQRIALEIARQARGDAMDAAQDAWLASRICEAYIWPHLASATEDRRSRLNAERLLEECADVFWQADETNRVVLNYKQYLLRATSPRQADWARAQLSRVYVQLGDFKQAVRSLKSIQATNDYSGFLRRLPWLEQQAKAQ